MLNQAYNALIRVIGLSGRLLLVLAIAKYLTPNDVGVFGVFQAGIMYAVYLVGFDFYAYSTRELVADYPRICGNKIGSQLFLYGLTYLIATPAIIGAFVLLGLGWWLAIVAIFFVFLEHSNQEMVRIVEAFGHPVLAGNLTIIRSGLWSIVAVAAIVFVSPMRNINSILVIWAVFGLLSTFITIQIIKKNFQLAGKLGFDWGWIKKGLIISSFFFIGTLAIRAIFMADKFSVKMLSVDELPAYILFSAFGMAVLSVIEASIFSFAYPKMLLHPSDFRKMRDLVKQCSFQAFVVGIILSAILLIVLPSLLNVIGHDAYIQQINLAPLILLSIFIYALGLGPHYGLYAMKMDRIIVISHIFGVFTFLCLAVYLGSWDGAKGVVMSQIMAFSVVAVIKATYFYNHSKSLV